MSLLRERQRETEREREREREGGRGGRGDRERRREKETDRDRQRRAERDRERQRDVALCKAERCPSLSFTSPEPARTAAPVSRDALQVRAPSRRLPRPAAHLSNPALNALACPEPSLSLSLSPIHTWGLGAKCVYYSQPTVTADHTTRHLAAGSQR